MVRKFKLPSEAHVSFKGYFSPTVGLEYRPARAYDKVKYLEMANKFVNKFGFGNLSDENLRGYSQEISAEVGDDQISLSKSIGSLAYEAVMHGLMGMKMSVEDTSINCHYGNFAEDLIVLPSGYGQTYLNSRMTNSGINSMSYIDVPKLRLAIDIRPMRMDHSGTNDGKASMIGARQRWIPLESPFRGTYEMFSLFQDVNLGLHRDKKFPYFPTSLGGYGKEPPFRNYVNFERFMKSFKQGTHSELIREIVQRTIDYLTAKSDGKWVKKDPLLSHIVRFQSSFHDWVKGRTIHAPTTWIDVPPTVAPFRLAKTGTSPQLDEAINRLLAEKRILSESQLEIAVEHNELCKSLLGAENILKAKEIRDKARKEWNSFSIFTLENLGYIKELNLEKSFRLKPLRQIDVSLFFSLINDHRYNLKHLLREEFVYDRRAMDEIYKVGPMKVHFSMFPLVGMNVRGFAAPTADYLADMEDSERIHSLSELEHWFVQDRSGPMPRTLINDDEEIVRLCSKSSYNIVITDDIRLCKRATKVTGAAVFRVPCEWYYSSLYFGTPGWDSELSRLCKGIEWTTHEDTGSIKAFEEGRFNDGVMLSRPRTQKFNIWKTPESWKDPVVLEEYLDFSDDITKYDVPRLFFDSRNILRLRAQRPRTYGRGW